MRRQRDQCNRDGPLEDDAVSGESIQMRRPTQAVSVGAQAIGASGVEGDEQDVGRVWRADGPTAQPDGPDSGPDHQGSHDEANAPACGYRPRSLKDFAGERKAIPAVWSPTRELEPSSAASGLPEVKTFPTPGRDYT